MKPLTASESESRDTHPDLLGIVLRGTYRILRVMDQGNMGTVFEAEHERLKRRLAVKVLSPHMAREPEALARFQREAEIISHLNHPNVVQVIDFDSTEAGAPYLVMEFLHGETLAARLEREGRLPLRVAVRLAHQVAAGLAAAHRAGVVHRDLKPANLFLVDLPFERTQVKILDFGISKSNEGRHRRLTGEHAVLGTPDYMAPEQAIGRAAWVDPRADQYSLGVILYEALTGHTPFDGQDVKELLYQVVAREPTPLTQYAPETPPLVWRVLRRALAKEPDERFPTVMEFASELLQAAGCSPWPSDPPARPLSGFPQSVFPAMPPIESLVALRGEYRHPGSERPQLSEPARDSVVPPERAVSIHPPPIRIPALPNPSSELSKEASQTPAKTSPGKTQPPKVQRADPVDEEIARILDTARSAFARNDLEDACSKIESALQLNQPGVSSRALANDSAFVECVFIRQLGSLHAHLQISSPQLAGNGPHLSPEQAFLLSRVDGHASVEDLLDLSPLPRRETLRHLVALLRLGLLSRGVPVQRSTPPVQRSTPPVQQSTPPNRSSTPPTR
ncbi:MAG TPA: protein kinase [Polyangiaceae bacterium]|nr:protein kinase [Polyangiaceae bacterium]